MDGREDSIREVLGYLFGYIEILGRDEIFEKSGMLIELIGNFL